MGKTILLVVAILTFAACTKEDNTKWIDGTSWRYSYIESSGRKITCNLSLKKGGELSITDQYSSWQTEWYDRFQYRVESYTYDGDKKGTIELQGVNYYSEDHTTAHFTLNYDQKKMSLSTPNGSYTLERTK